MAETCPLGSSSVVADVFCADVSDTNFSGRSEITDKPKGDSSEVTGLNSAGGEVIVKLWVMDEYRNCEKTDCNKGWFDFTPADANRWYFKPSRIGPPTFDNFQERSWTVTVASWAGGMPERTLFNKGLETSMVMGWGKDVREMVGEFVNFAQAAAAVRTKNKKVDAYIDTIKKKFEEFGSGLIFCSANAAAEIVEILAPGDMDPALFKDVILTLSVLSGDYEMGRILLAGYLAKKALVAAVVQDGATVEGSITEITRLLPPCTLQNCDAHRYRLSSDNREKMAASIWQLLDDAKKKLVPPAKTAAECLAVGKVVDGKGGCKPCPENSHTTTGEVGSCECNDGFAQDKKSGRCVEIPKGPPPPKKPRAKTEADCLKQGKTVDGKGGCIPCPDNSHTTTGKAGSCECNDGFVADETLTRCVEKRKPAPKQRFNYQNMLEGVKKN